MIVWGSKYTGVLTDLYRFGNSTPTNIRFWDQILGPTVKPYTVAVDPGFLWVNNSVWPHVARVFMQFPDDKGIDITGCPPRSHDLNPVGLSLGDYVSVLPMPPG